MDEEMDEYRISVGNILLGIYVFLVLRIPEDWTITNSEIPSEMHYSSETRGARWVTEGQAYHYLYNRLSHSSFQMAISCRRSLRLQELPHRVTKVAEGSMAVSGHPARYVVGSLKVGLIRKELMDYVGLAFVCEQTSRSIKIELKGRGSHDDVRRLLRSFENLKCHTL